MVVSCLLHGREASKVVLMYQFPASLKFHGKYSYVYFLRRYFTLSLSHHATISFLSLVAFVPCLLHGKGASKIVLMY